MTNKKLVESLLKHDDNLEVCDSSGNVVKGVIIIVEGTRMYLQLLK